MSQNDLSKKREMNELGNEAYQTNLLSTRQSPLKRNTYKRLYYSRIIERIIERLTN